MRRALINSKARKPNSSKLQRSRKANSLLLGIREIPLTHHPSWWARTMNNDGCTLVFLNPIGGKIGNAAFVVDDAQLEGAVALPHGSDEFSD